MRQTMCNTKAAAAFQLRQNNYHLSVTTEGKKTKIIPEFVFAVKLITFAMVVLNQQFSIRHVLIQHCNFPDNRISHESIYFRGDFLPLQLDRPSPNIHIRIGVFFFINNSQMPNIFDRFVTFVK